MTDKLTRDEVNRYIHERIMQKCWCDRFPLNCVEGHKVLWSDASTPDYCSDASPRSLLNEVVLQVTFIRGCTPYMQALRAIVNPTEMKMPIDKCLASTAEHIARACVEAWEAREDGE